MGSNFLTFLTGFKNKMADEETAVNGVEASADPAPSAAPTSKVIKIIFQ